MNPPPPSTTGPGAASPPPPVVGDPITVLERFETALAGLRAGLVDLEASPSYLMLTDAAIGPVTARTVGAAAREAADLWPLLNGVEGALAEIRRYQSDHGVAGKHGAEIVRLLSQRWIPIELPSSVGAASGSSSGQSLGLPPAPVPSPVSSGPPANAVAFAVGEALDAFRHRFDAIRTGVSQVNALFLDLLPRIDAGRKTLNRLDGEVQALGVPEPLIGRARALAQDLEQRLVADPLAVTAGDGAKLDADVAAAAAQVATLRSGHDSLEADLGATEELLAALRVLRAQAQAAGSEAEAKVVDPQGLVAVPSPAVLDGNGGLASRLDEITSRLPTSSWDQRRSLLDGWLGTARKLQAQLSRAEAANRAPLARRDELRGLLRAYQSKVSAVGRAEDLELTAIVDQARTELYTAPTDLDRAATIIEDLARRLRS